MKQWEPNLREQKVIWVWERMTAAWPQWPKLVGPVWDKKREQARKRKPHLWPKMTLKASIWADDLAPFTMEAVARAMHECELAKRPAPPPRIEFIALCRGERLEDNLRQRPVVEQETPVERDARIERGAKRLAEIRSMVRGA